MNINSVNSVPRDALPAGASGNVSTPAESKAAATPQVLGAGSTAATVKAAAPPSPVDVKQAVDQINRFMQSSNRSLAFSYDQQAQRIVVKITDSQTGELIRQIPSEEVLAISQAIGDIQQGMLLRQSA
jgi:flagellar protein FlaG